MSIATGTTTHTSIPVIPVEPLPGLALLDEYDNVIAALDLALRDADAARRTLDHARRRMDVAEARIIAAGVEGKNEAERKARLLLALLEDRPHRDADQQAQDAAEEQRQAERQVRVVTERCRLLRASLALYSGGE